MNESRTESLTQGCFFFNRKAPNIDYFESPVFPTLEGETEDAGFAQMRLKAFQNFWQPYEQKFTEILESSNVDQFEELVEFGRRAHLRKSTARTPYNEIPTALFLTGVNVPDHDSLFRELGRYFRKTLSPYFVNLHSKECGSLKDIIRAVVASLMGLKQIDDEARDTVSAQQQGRLPLCTMEVLSAWYEDDIHRIIEQTDKSGNKEHKKKPKAHRKRTASEVAAEVVPDQAPPVVILFRDFEAFDSKALADFIEVCESNKGSPPIIFLFGISSSASVVYRKLPRRALTSLNMERFGAVRQITTFDKIIRELTLANFHCYSFLSRPTAQSILSFLNKNLSLSIYLDSVKLAALEHFSKVPISFLLASSLESALQSVSQLNHSQLELIRALPSIMKYVESGLSKDKVSQRAFLTNDEACRQILRKELMPSFYRHSRQFSIALLALSEAVAALPAALAHLPQTLPALLSFCLKPNIREVVEFERFLESIGLLAADELVAILRNIVQAISRFRDTSNDAITNTSQLEGFMKSITEQQQAPSQRQTTSEPEPDEDSTAFSSGSVKRRNILLRKYAVKGQNPYHTLRNSVVIYLRGYFGDALQVPTTQPLHELFVPTFSITKLVEGKPKEALKSAMNKPSQYLASLSGKDDDIALHPDTLIIYQLQLECPRLINLHDLLQAFCALLGCTGPPSDELQARFALSLGHLQLMGLIKHTARKTDHAIRLTVE